MPIFVSDVCKSPSTWVSAHAFICMRVFVRERVCIQCMYTLYTYCVHTLSASRRNAALMAYQGTSHSLSVYHVCIQYADKNRVYIYSPQKYSIKPPQCSTHLSLSVSLSLSLSLMLLLRLNPKLNPNTNIYLRQRREPLPINAIVAKRNLPYIIYYLYAPSKGIRSLFVSGKNSKQHDHHQRYCCET